MTFTSKNTRLIIPSIFIFNLFLDRKCVGGEESTYSYVNPDFELIRVHTVSSKHQVGWETSKDQEASYNDSFATSRVANGEVPRITRKWSFEEFSSNFCDNSLALKSNNGQLTKKAVRILRPGIFNSQTFSSLYIATICVHILNPHSVTTLLRSRGANSER